MSFKGLKTHNERGKTTSLFNGRSITRQPIKESYSLWFSDLILAHFLTPGFHSRAPYWMYPTLCDPMDHSLPGSSVHGIHQARILEWTVIPFSRGSSQPRDWTSVSHMAGISFTIRATREAWTIIEGTIYTRVYVSSALKSLKIFNT